MPKFSYGTVGQTYFVNGSLVKLPGKDNIMIVNGTIIQLRLHEAYEDSQLNELLYVIIVIVFYATALMTLIITQIKRQRREGTEVDYYDEYLQRNSEVKRTCQAATTIVNKPPTNTQSQRVTAALASAAVAAASAGSIMGIHYEEEPTAGSALLTEEKETDTNSSSRFGAGESFNGKGRIPSLSSPCASGASTGVVGGSGGSGGSGGCGMSTTLLAGPNIGGLSSYGNTRTVLARERSPTRVLESIPDEGVEE